MPLSDGAAAFAARFSDRERFVDFAVFDAAAARFCVRWLAQEAGCRWFAALVRAWAFEVYSLVQPHSHVALQTS